MTSASPMTESSSMPCQATHPAAFMRGPATPANSASGKRRFSASMSAAPSASPEASPATSAIRIAISTDEAARRFADEVHQGLELRLRLRALLELGDRIGELELGPVQHAIGVLEIADLLGREAAPLQALRVDRVRHGGRADRHHVRRDVARDRGIVAEERMRADLRELVDAGVSAHDHPVADFHMAS